MSQNKNLRNINTEEKTVWGNVSFYCDAFARFSVSTLVRDDS